MRHFLLIPALAASALASTPSAAAPDYRDRFATSTRSAAFIGAQARLAIGSSKRAVPVARLTAGTANLSLNQHGALVDRPIGTTFELGFSRTGRTDFYVGGHRFSELQAKLGFAPAGVALLAIGGLALIGAGVADSAESTTKLQPGKPNEVVCLGIGVCPPPGG